jgi:hypothetical protein
VRKLATHPLPVLLAILVCAAGAAPHEQAHPVQLPYLFRDAFGSQWDVLYDGSIGDGGNDLYDGGGRLLFNNNVAQYMTPTQQAVLDPERNELAFPPMAFGGLNISRRVAVLPELSTLRFTEILENPTGAPITIQLRCYFNMGGSVQQSLPLTDRRRGGQAVGYALGDMNNAVAMVGAGRGSKLVPRFNFRQNDDNVDIFYDVQVPPHQTVAVVHCQVRRHSVSESQNAWSQIKDKELLRDMPRELRRRVVNFPTGDAFVGEMEILRGDAQDVVELRGGDTCRGTIKIERFNLRTPYGPLAFTPDKVVAVLNVGAFRPSQLVVTRDGEIFGGRLDVTHVPFRFTSGQVTQIPLAQVTRMGYRKRPGEPEEWDFENKTMAYLASGERMRVKLPGNEFNFATPSGPMRLSPGVVSSILFQGGDNNVPEVRLTDGSHFSALTGASAFDLTLVGLGAEQHACIPTAALSRFVFAPEGEVDAMSPQLTLANQDQFVGSITGTLSLETPFDTLQIQGEQIKKLTHTRQGGQDVQVTLWDDSTLSGRLVEARLSCRLKCGMTIGVPVALVETYRQPVPTPSPQVVERIEQMAHDLDDQSWPTRRTAQDRILAIGVPAIAVLKQLQPTARVEAAQRIALIIQQLSQELEKKSALPSAPRTIEPW